MEERKPVNRQWGVFRNGAKGRSLASKPFDLEENAHKEAAALAQTQPGWCDSGTPRGSWIPFIYEVVPIYKKDPPP